MNYQQAFYKLKKFGQLHVLKYYNDLSDEDKMNLLNQIEITDFSCISIPNKKRNLSTRDKIEPMPTMTIPDIEQNKENFFHIGLNAIKVNKTGALLLAGGMGTRLGVKYPKGIYNIGINKSLYIFECLINNLMDIVKLSKTWIYLFIMTSDKTHHLTIDFFEKHNYFGYNKNYIIFFLQEMSPTTDYNGKVFMEAKNKISTSPNGNGGWLSSLEKQGYLDKIQRLGIEWLNVFAVDNVLQRIVDPYFLGAVISEDFVMGAKVVKKASPDEKVGTICLKNGKPSIIEYFEITDEVINSKDENGECVYNYGVILNYFFNVKNLVEIKNMKMPIHLANKIIPYLDKNANLINPKQANGYKYETLVLDMVNLMDNCIAYEVERNKEFAPIKNKYGTDSVESARVLLKENGIEY